MTIRTIGAALLAVALLLTAVGCTGNTETETPEYPKLTLSGDNTTASATTTTTTAPSEEETTEEETDSTDVEQPNTVGEAIAQLATSLVGTPYQSGGNGPDAFDNPGFVVYCYRENGYKGVPRKATAIQTYGNEVLPDERQAGDILVFCNELGEEAGFVGIYIGNDEFVASTNPNTPTKVHKLNQAYWLPRLLAVRRY